MHDVQYEISGAAGHQLERTTYIHTDTIQTILDIPGDLVDIETVLFTCPIPVPLPINCPIKGARQCICIGQLNLDTSRVSARLGCRVDTRHCDDDDDGQSIVLTVCGAGCGVAKGGGGGGGLYIQGQYEIVVESRAEFLPLQVIFCGPFVPPKHGSEGLKAE